MNIPYYTVLKRTVAKIIFYRQIPWARVDATNLPARTLLSSRTKENGAVLSFVSHPQTLTVPCSLFPVPCSLISTVNFNCVHPLKTKFQRVF